MTLIEDSNRNIESFENEWPYRSFAAVEDNEDLTTFGTAITDPLDSIDETVQSLYESRYLETASGVELELLAREVGIFRQDGESDERLRYRAKLEKAIQASNNTFDDFLRVLEMAVGDDITDCGLTTSEATPSVDVEVPSSTIEELPVTRSVLEDIFRRAVPINDTINVTETGSLRLGGDSYTPDEDSRIGTGTLSSSSSE